MKRFALTGINIQHSKSAQLFAAAYHHSPDYSYELMPATSAEEAIRLFRKQNLNGMNITAPFKNDILHFVDEQSDEVKAIGATNTIVLRNGKIFAYNTDVDGVIGSFTNKNIDLAHEKAIVLGAGGAGQAAVYALKQAGAEVWCANRTEYRAEVLAARMKAYYLPTSHLDSQLQECRLLVNTLPEDAKILDELHLHKQSIVIDANYATHPLRDKTILHRGVYINGRSWLLYQAIPAYTLFTGKQPDIEKMEQLLSL